MTEWTTHLSSLTSYRLGISFTSRVYREPFSYLRPLYKPLSSLLMKYLSRLRILIWLACFTDRLLSRFFLSCQLWESEYVVFLSSHYEDLPCLSKSRCWRIENVFSSFMNSLPLWTSPMVLSSAFAFSGRIFGWELRSSTLWCWLQLGCRPRCPHADSR